MNRGRHKKQYPNEINDLRYKKEFKQTFTPEETRLLINHIYKNMSYKRAVSLRNWELDPTSIYNSIGFVWMNTKEGFEFWNNKIHKFMRLIKQK